LQDKVLYCFLFADNEIIRFGSIYFNIQLITYPFTAIPLIIMTLYQQHETLSMCSIPSVEETQENKCVEETWDLCQSMK